MEAASAPRTHGVRIPKPRRLLATLSDERLVEHVRRGEAAAFEVLYDRYSAGILGFCRHVLGSANDAEDATQQAFIAAHADILRHGERDLHVKAWLYTIARNRCLSMLRARREAPAADSIEIVTGSFTDDVQQREDLRILLADVQKLPDDQREALVLAEVGDLSHEEISNVLHCEASKVKSLVFQARTALIDRRIARETPCSEIREQIATLRGGALRRSYLRHHVEACPGCAEYREQVRRQRAMLALALPVVPSAALKANVLGSIGWGGGSAAAAVSGGGAGATSAGLLTQGGVAAKTAVVAALAIGGGGTAAVVHNGGIPLLHHAHPAAQEAAPAARAADHRGGSSAANVAAPTSATKTDQHGHATSSTTSSGHKTSHHRSASGTAHGFTPTTGSSNGAAARQFAQTRGKGKHTGLTKTHHATGHANKPSGTHVKRHTAHTPPPPPAPKSQAHHVTTTPVPAPKSTAPTETQTAPAPAPTTPVPSGTTPGAGQGGAVTDRTSGQTQTSTSG